MLVEYINVDFFFFIINALESGDFRKIKYNTVYECFGIISHDTYTICISLQCCSKYGFHLFKNNLIEMICEC